MIGIRLLCVLIGYVFGLFQTAYIYGRLHGIDIRQHGSGNSGTTNMLRTKGLKAGLITFLGDVIKCVLAVVVVGIIFGQQYPEYIDLLKVYAALGVILGHDFPCYLGFKGGKGIAATAGFIIAMGPVHIICGLLVFGFAYGLTKYVSFGSIMLYIALIIEMVVLGEMSLNGVMLPMGIGYYNLSRNLMIEMYIIIVFLTFLTIFLHRENIKRLLSGTERKTELFKKKENN